MNYAQPAIKLLSGRIEEPISFQLPGTEIDRVFVVVYKEKKGDKKYPRKPGTAEREPLGNSKEKTVKKL